MASPTILLDLCASSLALHGVRRFILTTLCIVGLLAVVPMLHLPLAAGAQETDCAAEIGKAAALRKERNFAEADALLKECLLQYQAKNPDSVVVARVLEALGASYFEQGLFDEAEKYWRQGLDARRKGGDPLDLELIQNLEQVGKLAYRAGKQDEAQAFYNEAKSLRLQRDEADRKRVAALQVQGVTALKAGRPAESITAFSEMLKLAPKNTLAQRNLFIAYDNQGIAFYEKSEYVPAESSFKQAIALAKKYTAISVELKADAVHNLASLSHRQGKFDEAQKYYKEAIDLLGTASNKQLLPRVISNYNDLQTDMRRQIEQKKFRQKKETAIN